MKKLIKLKKGEKVAIVSPSFAASAVWPHVHELGLKRLREVLELEPVEYPATAKLDATTEEKSADLIAAFSDPDIKAVISTLGGDIQVTYIKKIMSVESLGLLVSEGSWSESKDWWLVELRHESLISSEIQKSEQHIERSSKRRL
jgi:hypothetical protein